MALPGSKNGKSITPRPATGPPIQINSTKSTEGDRKRDEFSEKLRVTYTLENRSFSLELSEEGFVDRVFGVEMEIVEEMYGKGSATIGLMALVNQSYGISCGMTNEFKGSFEVQKGKFCFPPVPDTEFLAYSCPEIETPSCFILEKKSDTAYVERVTAAHCFAVSEDAVYTVTIKITGNKGTGLSVEVEGPTKRTKHYTERLFSRLGSKVERAATELFLNAIFNGPAKDDTLKSFRYGNSGTQNFKGLVNTSGFMKGFGNGAFFSNCKFLGHK